MIRTHNLPYPFCTWVVHLLTVPAPAPKSCNSAQTGDNISSSSNKASYIFLSIFMIIK